MQSGNHDEQIQFYEAGIVEAEKEIAQISADARELMAQYERSLIDCLRMNNR